MRRVQHFADRGGTRRPDLVTRVLVVDDLRYGLAAGEAADEALRVFRARAGSSAEVIEDMPAALRLTRGAAAAFAEIDSTPRVPPFAGIGNISGTLVAPAREYNRVSHNGTLGHSVRKIQPFTCPWPEGAVLVLRTDGVSHRWDLRNYPGRQARMPVLVAGVLYRDFRRERDDATGVVARGAQQGGSR